MNRAAGRPVVGVSCYLEAIDRDPWVAQRSVVLPADYVAHLERAGAVAMLVPPRPDADADLARTALARVDALVLAGGADVDATRYGAERHPSAQAPRPDRDGWELALVAAAVERDLPVLGVCRGMQVLAVAAGARLEQHLPDRVGHHGHCPRPGVFVAHQVTPVAGSALADILGAGPLEVPTYHHQGVVPESLERTGWVAAAWHDDGTLEAMENPAGRFRLGVQWHPEAGDDARLFDALVLAATEAVR
ncbi:MAG: gamma-glutamyl-gamma-aminobutyrate hydrolase family protein [Dermatophilaceae bacterium]